MAWAMTLQAIGDVLTLMELPMPVPDAHEVDVKNSAFGGCSTGRLSRWGGALIAGLVLFGCGGSGGGEGSSPIGSTITNSIGPIAITEFSLSDRTDSTFTLALTSNIAGTGYLLTLAHSAPVPTASSIQTNGIPVSLSAGIPASAKISGLHPSYSYVIYVLAKDSHGSEQTTIQSMSAQTGRDPLKWPFETASIWNMPIGSGAQYVPANLAANPTGGSGAPAVDDERIVMKPTAPLTAINYSSAAWTGANRCSATGGTLVNLPIPTNYVVPNGIDNSSASFLAADGRTIIQSQPFTRCTAGGPATSLLTFPAVDLYGDGIRGSHGGSGLSAIGGSIRVGELRPGQQGMQHAIKINVGAPSLYACTTQATCYRWPANTADSYWSTRYGRGTGANNTNAAMKMGALLGIPATVNIANLGLETEPGKQLAWTLQNYGAYIVDTYKSGPAYAFNAENGPDGSLRAQFKADWGYDFEQRAGDASGAALPWTRDIQKLIQAVYVVDNNALGSVGGGGAPRQPLAVRLDGP